MGDSTTGDAMPRRLNIGCGTDIRPGYFNVDRSALPGVDRQFDLATLPWPLPDAQFDEVLCDNILEHLWDCLGTMEEIWRVCRDGAKVHVRVPNWSSRWAWQDPTHVRPFTPEVFGFWDPDHGYCKQRPYYTPARFRVEAIVYEGCWFRPAWQFTIRAEGLRVPRRIRFLELFSNTVHFLQVELRAVKQDL
ncbi:MAG: methyltransferase domain-containing protein [Candidatus Hydrogenedentes bacterium]|nr:methyltransferase domain-containing protein [Candidatus Hydrogenedentota bacterium]